jgi:6,7-dimethyl-8-ribityllumazine synthase
MPKSNFRIAIVVSRFNEPVTSGLKRGALAYLAEQGIKVAEGDIYSAPGAFEVPLIAQTLAKSKQYDGVVCLGCVIKGDTAHFEFISLGATYGRDDAHNKGREAAAACVETLETMAAIKNA